MRVPPFSLRRCVCLVALPAFATGEAVAQYGVSQGLPASAVMAHGVHDGWHSQGGVVGPWWTGSGSAAQPPATNGGFWFGFPGLGFGGSQGSTSGMNSFGSSVTTMQGGSGMVSSSRLIPFVTGVVPVVGNGYPVTPVTTGFGLDAARPPILVTLPPVRPQFPMAGSHTRSTGMSSRPSTPEARHIATEIVTASDLILQASSDCPATAKALLRDYRSAARFASDDADIEIRIAMLHEALGKRRDADRAIARAKGIDRRLAESITSEPADAGGFLAPSPEGIPVIAVRGFLILDEIAHFIGAADATEPSGEQPPVVAWLSEAWARRWGCTSATALRCFDD